MAAPLKSLLLVTALLSAPFTANAIDRTDLFVQTGMVSGTFQGKGVDSGSFMADINVGAEVWLYKNPSEAWVFHMLVDNESKLGRARYFSGGLGQRFFVGTDGLMTSNQMGADYFKSRPDWAYFLGWNIDTGQFLVAPFGETLASYATMVDVGGTLGIRRILTQQISMDATIGYAFGGSITSSPSATASYIRALVGIGFLF